MTILYVEATSLTASHEVIAQSLEREVRKIIFIWEGTAYRESTWQHIMTCFPIYNRQFA
jgi:hypothetical protein